MRTVNFLCLVIFLTILVDFSESYYYLELHGYHLELNPLITNREQLVLSMCLRIVVVIIVLPVLNFCYKIIGRHRGAFIVSRLLVESVLLITLALNFFVITNNLFVIINS